jgi:hypothetical protein
VNIGDTATSIPPMITAPRASGLVVGNAGTAGGGGGG